MGNSDESNHRTFSRELCPFCQYFSDVFAGNENNRVPVFPHLLLTLAGDRGGGNQDTKLVGVAGARLNAKSLEHLRCLPQFHRSPASSTWPLERSPRKRDHCSSPKQSARSHRDRRRSSHGNLGPGNRIKGPKGWVSPRCLKDLIEEELFERRRDLFAEVDLVFFDYHSPLL